MLVFAQPSRRSFASGLMTWASSSSRKGAAADVKDDVLTLQADTSINSARRTSFADNRPSRNRAVSQHALRAGRFEQQCNHRSNATTETVQPPTQCSLVSHCESQVTAVRLLSCVREVADDSGWPTTCWRVSRVCWGVLAGKCGVPLLWRDAELAHSWLPGEDPNETYCELL